MLGNQKIWPRLKMDEKVTCRWYGILHVQQCDNVWQSPRFCNKRIQTCCFHIIKGDHVPYFTQCLPKKTMTQYKSAYMMSHDQGFKKKWCGIVLVTNSRPPTMTMRNSKSFFSPWPRIIYEKNPQAIAWYDVILAKILVRRSYHYIH